MSDEAIVA